MIGIHSMKAPFQDKDYSSILYSITMLFFYTKNKKQKKGVGPRIIGTDLALTCVEKYGIRSMRQN